MNRFVYLTFIVVLLAWSKPQLQAQHSQHGTTMHQCGISFEDQLLIRERVFENRRNMDNLMSQSRSDDTLYIPVTAHLTAANNGSGRYRMRNMLNNLCKLNADFADQNIKFYLKTGYFPEINSDALYLHDDRSTAAFLMDVYKEPDAINLFITQSAGDLPNGGTAGGYYTPSVDVIVLTIGNILPNRTTLSHEVGHYLTLPHPFFGWEATPYTNGTVAPVTVPYAGQNIYVETQPRSGINSNCHIAADGFCGTNPNYYFDAPSSTCTFTGNAIDPVGNTVTTDENNIMSYFPEVCTNEFSQDQKDAMRADAIARGYNTTMPPTLNTVDNTPTLLNPINNNVAFNPDQVHLTWEPVTNATRYLVTIERSEGVAGWSFYSNTIVEQPEAWMSVDPNRQFRWSVYPFNQYDFCGNSESSFGTFRSLDWAVGVEELANVQEWKLYPNPVEKGATLFMEMRSANNAEAHLTVYNVMGQQVRAPRAIMLVQGENTVSVETMDLPTGVYSLTLETNEGVQTKQFVIQ